MRCLSLSFSLNLSPQPIFIPKVMETNKKNTIFNNAKKTQVPPVFEQPGQIGEEEEILPNVEEYTITENKDVSDGPVIQEIVADYYRDPKVMIDDRDELPAEENEEEEHVQFDIRQAIISSEILKRPQY